MRYVNLITTRKPILPTQTYNLPDLPPRVDFETRTIMRVLNEASRALAQFNGNSKTVPNQDILVSTLFLQEALASSEIENIVTTEDELFRADLFQDNSNNPAAKEVTRYRDALHHGYRKMEDANGILSSNLLIELFQILKQQQDGFRKTPGTVLRSQQTGEDIYVPPQESDEIIRLMNELETFINRDDLCDLDPLIKMTIIHHQFESIHPFSDGNGRIGRILNVLYLTRTGLLNMPILYISREITRRKSDYYRLLQAVRDENEWEEWVVFMLHCVCMAALNAQILVNQFRILMQNVKIRMREQLPKIYSQDLLNNLFRHPYTRIDFVMRDLNVTRQTASRYLNLLAKEGFVTKVNNGRSNYFINDALVKLFLNVSKEEKPENS